MTLEIFVNIELRNMRHIKDLLKKNIAAAGLTQGVSAAQIVTKAQDLITELFPDSIAQRIRAEHIKEGTLVIICSSSAAAQECNRFSQTILTKLHEVFGKKLVRGIKITVQHFHDDLP